MSCFGRPRRLAISLLLLPLCLEAACSRPGVSSADGATPADQHQVPFRDGDGSAHANPDSSAAAQNNGAKPESDLPFHDLQSLPVGTLLTVRLKNSVSADNSGTSATFEGVVDEPVLIEGNTLVPRGAGVAGRVEYARASGMKRSGYVRLTLDSIDIAGKGSTPADLQPVRARECSWQRRFAGCDHPRKGSTPHLSAQRTGLRRRSTVFYSSLARSSLATPVKPPRLASPEFSTEDFPF